ncbi:MAG TPA: TolC family protein [Allosphingosinicella sp.]
MPSTPAPARVPRVNIYQAPTVAAPSGTPLAAETGNDPILQLSQRHAGFEQFRQVVAWVVEHHPATAEAHAGEDEAMAALEEVRQARIPTVDLSMTSYRVIARDFSDDPDNIIERSRPAQRTDAILSAQQTIFDFGATSRRIAAAGARLRAAGAELEATADRTAINTVAAWYDVFAYRAMATLTEAFVGSQMNLRAAVQRRISEGVNAEGDLARVDSYIADTQNTLARFRRLRANAEARFTALTGSPPPADLQRAPSPGPALSSSDAAILAASEAAAVRSAQAVADASRQDARAARSDRMPRLSVGLDAGRYGVFENNRDYDIRGSVALRYRLFGGVDPRAEQAEARARSADARASLVREEAGRDAAIAWSDVRALEEQFRAVEAAYIASRQSRDVIVERFRVARGTLFDVVAAEDSYFESATSYIQVLSELDAARYVLLSRTGRLLDVLEIDPDRLRGTG